LVRSRSVAQPAKAHSTEIYRLATQRQAAIDRMIASMNEPVTLRGGFRTFTRDEMHEC
jgi:hypothetical protein